MTGRELVKKIKVLGKKQDLVVHIEKRRGKGSHVTLFYGKYFAIIPDLKKELKTGTLNAILKQLSIKATELR